VLAILSAVLLILSIYPIVNMISSHQMMNASFDRLHLMNTYGAFGSVGKVRNEIIIEGTDAAVPDDGAQWREYEFLAKPGDVRRRPPFIAPYQSRIDWQMWFAAMEDYSQNPWFVHLLYQLLKGNSGAISLLRSNPFPNRPPRFIRAEIYEYHFSKDHSSGQWWERKKVGRYFPAISADDPELLRYIHGNGWQD